MLLPRVLTARGSRTSSAPSPMKPPNELLQDFRVSRPELMAQTGIATVWKVRTADGDAAALKLYRGTDMGAERHGFRLMESCAGAAQVYRITAQAALIEWLDGPSLGDLARGGRDREASVQLVAVANALHASMQDPGDLPTLSDRFRALTGMELGASCPGEPGFDLLRAQGLVRYLLATQEDIGPLHGDLHHDNIRQGARGYVAFDAKGLLGERAFELANAFRHPGGMESLVRNPARIRGLALDWGRTFEVDANRLLQWAAVKCALSIAWRIEAPPMTDPEFDLLAILLGSRV